MGFYTPVLVKIRVLGKGVTLSAVAPPFRQFLKKYDACGCLVAAVSAAGAIDSSLGRGICVAQ